MALQKGMMVIWMKHLRHNNNLKKNQDSFMISNEFLP